MAENVSTTFPHPELTILADSRPTFLSLQTLHAEIQSNAESVPSIRGNGELFLECKPTIRIPGNVKTFGTINYAPMYA